MNVYNTYNKLLVEVVVIGAMDSNIDNLKEEVDLSDNNDKLDKLKKSYLILKQKVCRSHDLIKLYNDKLKECERIKIDLDLANKETKKMTSNYNVTLAKVIKLELQNAEYKKDIESLSSTIAAHETKMAGDRQHLQQLTCKMKELEETHMDKIMQLDLDKSLLQENIKELKCQLKISNKNCDSSKRKTNKKQQSIESDENIHFESTISMADVAVNTESNVMSTVDVGVNTVDNSKKPNALIEKSVMTDISCNIYKNDPFPLFCNKCESILSNPYDQICRSMTKHPRLIEVISSPIKSLHTESITTAERDENFASYHDNNEICNFRKSSGDINALNNSSNLSSISLKPELSLQDHHIIRSKSFADLVINPISHSNQFNGLPNVMQTPCLISESNNLSNLTTSSNSVHVLEKLEEKMKKLEKKIKKQSRKRKQLNTNNLQYFPHMNFYPNDVLSQKLSLNMASTFWNEVKNLMNSKQDTCVENQKKRHASKLCKFSSKKVKLKHCLRQNNILLRNNAWNVDSITPSPIQPKAVDNSTATDYLKPSSVDVLSNLESNVRDTALHNFSNEVNSDKDKSCDALIKETAKNTILFSTSKDTSYAKNIQDDESSELSSCEDMKDSILNSMEDTNLSDFNDKQCYTSTVKKSAQQINDIPVTAETCNTKSKNYFKNRVTDTATTTTINTSTTSTTSTDDSIAINDVATTTRKASTASRSAITNDKCNESKIDKETNIPCINEFSNTESLRKMSQTANSVQCKDRVSDFIDEYKINNYSIIAANSITVANTSPTTNATTTVTSFTSHIITTTNNVSANSCGTTTTTSTRIVTRAQKRRLQCNSQMDSLTEKKNNKIYDNKITNNTSENAINNQSNTVEDCISRKKQRISYEISNNQKVSIEDLDADQVMDDDTALTCKATNSNITQTNLNKSNYYNDTSEVNASILKERKSTEATLINPLDDFVTNVYNNECMEEESNNESSKAGHSNTRLKNADLHSKGLFPVYKSTHLRLMDHLKHLRNRPPSKISDFEMFHSNEPRVEDNHNSNKEKCAFKVVHNKNSEIKNNVIESYSNMNGEEEYKLQSKSVDLSIQTPNGISQQDESNLYSDKYQTNLEKIFDVVNTTEQSGLIKETNEVLLRNNIGKDDRTNFEASTTLKDIAMLNENNMDNQVHNMEIITSEKNEKLDNNTSVCLEIASPVTMLNNHFNKNKSPKGLRTTKKALKEMAAKCKVIDNFVKRQLHRIIGNSDWGISQHTNVVNKLSACTARIVANGIVEFMLEREIHNLDKTYTPPAPLMTVVQQRIIALLVDLEIKMPTVITFVQAGIEYKVFRLNKTPTYTQIQNLIRLYVVLARIQKDREKVRILCCDAIYCLGLHAIPVLYTALTSWPEIFPQFTENTDILPTCMAHIISSYQAIDFPQLNPLKHLIVSYYKFKTADYLSKNLIEELLNSLEGNHSSTRVSSLKIAIILLAKKEGTSWTYKNVIQANLLPKIVQRKYSSIYEAFCLLGHLLRTFPVEDNTVVKDIIDQLSDLIESGEGSEDLQEGIISALLSLCRHNFGKVAESVMKWTPTKHMREFTTEQYASLFTLRPSMHWKGFIKKILNKM